MIYRWPTKETVTIQFLKLKYSVLNFFLVRIKHSDILK